VRSWRYGRRYEAVIHLVTAAYGAEPFYGKSTNNVRYETLEQARHTDLKLREAWIGHPHLFIIDNATDFQAKINRVQRALLLTLGLPTPVEFQRKFLVKPLDFSQITQLPVSRVEIFDVEETFLKTADGTEAKVRRRGQNGSFVYMHSIRYPKKNGQRVERKRQISGREYVNLVSSLADSSLKPVKKRRACFVYNTQSYVLDTLIEPVNGPTFLRIEAENITQQVDIPPFLELVKEVTGHADFSSLRIAKNSNVLNEHR